MAALRAAVRVSCRRHRKGADVSDLVCRDVWHIKHTIFRKVRTFSEKVEHAEQASMDADGHRRKRVPFSERKSGTNRADWCSDTLSDTLPRKMVCRRPRPPHQGGRQNRDFSDTLGKMEVCRVLSRNHGGSRAVDTLNTPFFNLMCAREKNYIYIYIGKKCILPYRFEKSCV